MDNCRIRRINYAMRETFRLATFNCEHLDWSASKADVFARRCAALRPVLDALDADILCLQEIDAQKRHKHGPRDYLALDYLLEGGRYADFHRAATRRPETGAPADVHNLAILSRWPIVAMRQIHHDYAPRWDWPPPSENCVAPPPVPIVWDRPLLCAAIAAPGGLLHVIACLPSLLGRYDGGAAWGADGTQLDAADLDRAIESLAAQIGRASCRERV